MMPEERLTASHWLRVADLDAVLAAAVVRPPNDLAEDDWGRWWRGASPIEQSLPGLAVERVARYCALPVMRFVHGAPDRVDTLSAAVQEAIVARVLRQPQHATEEALAGAVFLLTRFGTWSRVREACQRVIVAAGPMWWTRQSVVARSTTLGRCVAPLLRRLPVRDGRRLDAAAVDLEPCVLCVRTLVVNGAALVRAGDGDRLEAAVRMVGAAAMDGGGDDHLNAADLGQRTLALARDALPRLLLLGRFEAWGVLMHNNTTEPSPMGGLLTPTVRMILHPEGMGATEDLMGRLAEWSESEGPAFGAGLAASPAAVAVLDALIHSVDHASLEPASPFVPNVLRLLAHLHGEPASAWDWIGNLHRTHTNGVRVDTLGQLLDVVDARTVPRWNYAVAGLLVQCLGGDDMEDTQAATHTHTPPSPSGTRAAVRFSFLFVWCGCPIPCGGGTGAPPSPQRAAIRRWSAC